MAASDCPSGSLWTVIGNSHRPFQSVCVCVCICVPFRAWLCHHTLYSNCANVDDIFKVNTSSLSVRDKHGTWLGLAVVALPLPVRPEGEAQLVRVVGQGFARGVRAVVGAAVLALVGRAGVGHLHLMAPLRQRLVGFTVHLLHGSKRSV